MSTNTSGATTAPAPAVTASASTTRAVALAEQEFTSGSGSASRVAALDLLVACCPAVPKLRVRICVSVLAELPVLCAALSPDIALLGAFCRAVVSCVVDTAAAGSPPSGRAGAWRGHKDGSRVAADASGKFSFIAQWPVVLHPQYRPSDVLHVLLASKGGTSPCVVLCFLCIAWTPHSTTPFHTGSGAAATRCHLRTRHPAVRRRPQRLQRHCLRSRLHSVPPGQ